MQLLLLLLSFLHFLSCQTFDVNRRLRFDSTDGASIEAKQKLAKDLGVVDLEARKARLSRLRPNREIPSEVEKTTVNTAKIEEPGRVNDGDDIPEVNFNQGVAEYLFEGDINLSEDQLADIENQRGNRPEGNRSKRQANLLYKRWTNNTVYFYIDATLPVRNAISVRKALAFFEENTCLKIVEDATAPNRIKFYDGEGCRSEMGMKEGEQKISLGSGCTMVGQSAHEFMHSLGIGHMQGRVDRDNYVTVSLTYVEKSSRGNFGAQDALTSMMYTPYEYSSGMHYASNYFTSPRNESSIVPKDERYMYSMGGRQISFYDIAIINAHYGCESICAQKTSAKCKNGGVPNPNNCSVCICPGGYGGALCNQRPEGCGDTLTATATPTSLLITVGSMEKANKSRDDHSYCNYWIKSPAGFNLQVKVVDMVQVDCAHGCSHSGIEVKGDLDQRATNPRYCCNTMTNTPLTSYVNPTPIRAYTSDYYSQFKIEYVAVPSGSVSPAPMPITVPVTTATTTMPFTNRCNSYKNGHTCRGWKSTGYCNNLEGDNWYKTKYNCAEECDLCGLPPLTCMDVDSDKDCRMYQLSGNCTSNDPMYSEYHCGKTCGFCERPN